MGSLASRCCRIARHFVECRVPRVALMGQHPLIEWLLQPTFLLSTWTFLNSLYPAIASSASFIPLPQVSVNSSISSEESAARGCNSCIFCKDSAFVQKIRRGLTSWRDLIIFSIHEAACCFLDNELVFCLKIVNSLGW